MNVTMWTSAVLHGRTPGTCSTSRFGRHKNRRQEVASNNVPVLYYSVKRESAARGLEQLVFSQSATIPYQLYHTRVSL
jgi:hypothetical protein